VLAWVAAILALPAAIGVGMFRNDTALTGMMTTSGKHINHYTHASRYRYQGSSVSPYRYNEFVPIRYDQQLATLRIDYRYHRDYDDRVTDFGTEPAICDAGSGFTLVLVARLCHSVTRIDLPDH
jgi:hypothetical protein